MLPLIGLGLAVAGGVANYAGGERAASAEAAALARYQRRREELMNQLMIDQYAGAREGQDALGEYLSLLSGTMGQAGPTAATTGEQGVTVKQQGGRDDAWAAAAEASRQPAARVQDANLGANQAGLNRAALAEALQGLQYSTNLPVSVGRTGHQRFSFLNARQMAENEARYAGRSIPNSARNLQLLGSGLGLLGQAGIMAGANTGMPGPQDMGTSVSSLTPFGGSSYYVPPG
jgi:hypothetical protein